MTSRRSKLQEDTYFRVLRILQDRPDVTQREIAQLLGVSTSGLNYCLNALIDKGLLKEVNANRKLNDPVWRETDEGRLVTLLVTDAGLAAIGIEVEHQKTKTQKSEPKTTPTERKIREGRNSAFSGTDPGVQRSRRS